MDVRDAVLSVGRRMGVARVIDSGLCDAFARAVHELAPLEIEVVNDEDLILAERGLPIPPPENRTWDLYAHTFLRAGGRFYDVQTPDGVDRWRDLLFYRDTPPRG